MGQSVLKSLFTSDVAVDLGTSNTLVFLKGEGVVSNEPTCIAVKRDKNSLRHKVVAYGLEAKNMLGRNPASLSVLRPVKDGVISDFDGAGELLKRSLKKALASKGFTKPRVLACVPSGVTEVERRAVRTSALTAGAREVFIIDEPIAAAVGAGLPVTEPSASLIMDIGGGTAEIAVISLKGIVYSRSLRVGGDKIDEAIMQYVKRRHNILIGERTSEQVKVAIGSVGGTSKEIMMEIRGRDVVQGTPRAVVVTQSDISNALSEIVNSITDMVRITLEKSPPELSSDIVSRGLHLSGGTSLLRGLPEHITKETGVPVKLVDDPFSSVVKGCAIVLDRIHEFRDLLT